MPTHSSLEEAALDGTFTPPARTASRDAFRANFRKRVPRGAPKLAGAMQSMGWDPTGGDLILNDADLRAFEDGHDADMAKELAQADAMEAAGLSLPGRAGSGRGGKVTKADLEYDAEQAKIRDEKIALDLALNQAIADRNAAQKLIQDLGGGSGRNVERIAVLQRELANGNPNADGYKVRAAELEKLQKFTANLSQATATLGDAEARINAAQSAMQSIPEREAAAARRRDFNLEAEMKLERKDRRGKRADRLGEARTRLEKAIKGYNDSAGTDAEGYYKGEMADAQADLERLSARGGKRGKGKGEGEPPVAAPSAASISPETRAYMKEGGMTDAEIDEMAPFIAVEEPAPAAEIKTPLAVEPEATVPPPASAPAIPGWDGKYDSFAPAPAPVPRKSVVGPAGAPRRAVLSVEPQPLDPPIAPAANPYSWGPRRSGLFDMGPTYRAEQQAESDRREEERRGPERAEMARRINAARAARRASGNQ